MAPGGLGLLVALALAQSAHALVRMSAPTQSSRRSALLRTAAGLGLTGLRLRQQPAGAAELGPGAGVLEFGDRDLRDAYKRARVAETNTPPDYAKAYKLYAQLSDAAPDNVLAWAGRGNTATALGQVEEALEAYASALRLAGDAYPSTTWMVHLNRGAVYLSTGEAKAALRDLQRAGIEGPAGGDDRLLLLQSRAQCYERVGNYPAAVEDYRAALVPKPAQVAPWWERYALSLLETGDNVNALAIMRRVAAKYEFAAEPQAALAACEAAGGTMPLAIKAFRAIAVSELPTYTDVAYLENKLHWPPKAITGMLAVTKKAKEEEAAARALKSTA